MDFKRIVFRTALLFGAAALLMSAGCGLPGVQSGNNDGGVNRAVTITANATGTDTDGFFYAFWKQDDTGTVSMTRDTGTTGNYAAAWSNCSSFVAGKGWATGTADRVIRYSGSFNGGDNGFLAVYGWMESPLVEYFILETWGSWDPSTDPMFTYKGTVDSDGGNYKIYTRTLTNAPNITGTNQNYTQYWSMRTSKRSLPATGSGTNTITIANHFTRWQALGMTLGTFAARDYQILETEGYRSTGSSTITISGGAVSKTWQALGAGVNNTVRALVCNSADLYVGGQFTQAGGGTRNRIAKYSNNSWSSLGSGMNNEVDALAYSGGTLYAGGWFTQANGGAAAYVAKYSGSWSALGSGMNQKVNAIVYGSSRAYVGGNFTTAGGTAANRIARWNGSAWSALGSLGAGMDSLYINALVRDSSGNLYAGWTEVIFSGMSSTFAYRVSKWNGSAWSDLGTFNNSVNALAASGSTVYAGGGFTTVGGTAANRVAKWNGSTWSALGTGVNGAVQALACDSSGSLYAGGSFTTAGGTTANRVARYSGTAWSALGTGIGSGTVYALALDSSGNLYAGGSFTSPGSNIAVYK